jgi:hypothetical protein
MPYVMGFPMALLVLFSSFVLPVSQHHLAYANTFSASESAQFLSPVEQIKAEAAKLLPFTKRKYGFLASSAGVNYLSFETEALLFPVKN